MISFVPPPLDGWAIETRTSWTQNPVTDQRADVRYLQSDGQPAPGEDGFATADQVVSIRVAQSPDQAAAFAMFYGNESLRNQFYVPGPYNYPASIVDNGVVLGDIHVTVSSGSQEIVYTYLAAVINCAIQNDMVAAALDVSTLRAEP